MFRCMQALSPARSSGRHAAAPGTSSGSPGLAACASGPPAAAAAARRSVSARLARPQAACTRTDCALSLAAPAKASPSPASTCKRVSCMHCPCQQSVYSAHGAVSLPSRPEASAPEARQAQSHEKDPLLAVLAASAVLCKSLRTGQLEGQRQRGQAPDRLGRCGTHGWRRVGRERGRCGRPGALAQLRRHGCEHGAGCRGRRCVRGYAHRGRAVGARLGPQSMIVSDLDTSRSPSTNL